MHERHRLQTVTHCAMRVAWIQQAIPVLQGDPLLCHDHTNLRHGSHGHEKNHHERCTKEAASISNSMTQLVEQRAHHETDCNDLQSTAAGQQKFGVTLQKANE